jgi:hypothetical protein
MNLRLIILYNAATVEQIIMLMSQISSLSELMKLSNSSYRVYDIGRKIEKLSKTSFEKIERQQLPFPNPLQGHAYLAIAFWQQQGAEPFLWFIKLPLDEQGLLNQGARNHFIAIIIEALGKNLAAETNKRQDELLKGNPYHFTPPQYKLAALNSILKFELKQNASSHYEHCQLYLSGKLGWQQWQGVGVQGLCDIAARLESDNNASLIAESLNALPLEVLTPLATALENQLLPQKLLAAVLKELQQQPEKPRQLALLRTLAASCDHPKVSGFIQALLNQQQLSLEILVTIAGRCWLQLKELSVMMSFLEQLIKLEDTQAFNSIFQDLIAIPAIRPVMMQAIRQPDRSAALVKAIGQLFKQVKGNHD